MLKRLEGIAPQVNTDWAQNNARQVQKLMQALWLASCNLQAAEAVRRAASPGVLLKEAVDYLRTCLQPKAADQAGGRSVLWDAARRLEAIVQFVPTLPDNRSESDAVKESANQVRQGLEMLGDPEKNQETLNSMQDALERLKKTVKSRLKSEATHIADHVRSASVHARSETTSMPDEWHSLTEHLDQIAYRFYGDPAYWRLLAQANHIDNPLRLAPNQSLVMPPIPRAQSGSAIQPSACHSSALK